MAQILFVHSNVPAQFVGVAGPLRAAGHRGAATGSHTARALPVIPLARWTHARGTTPGIWPDAARAEAGLISRVGGWGNLPSLPWPGRGTPP